MEKIQISSLYNVDDAQATFLQEVTDGLREELKPCPNAPEKYGQLQMTYSTPLTVSLQAQT